VSPRSILLASLAVAGMLVVRGSGDGPKSGGPLAEALPANAVTFSVNARDRFTYGGVQLRNAGDAAVTIVGIRLVDATPGLRVVQASALPIADTAGGLWFSYERFPPPGLPVEKLQPLAGFELRPGVGTYSAGVQVLLVLTVPGDGTHEFHSVAVDYRVGGERYVALYPFAMRVCAPSMELGQCPELRPGD
jgi:hypothetical protein